MKIIVDEVKKEMKLIKNDGKVVSTYSYKNAIDDEFTVEDLKHDLDGFNKTLEGQGEFDNIKGLRATLNIHMWE